MLSKEEREYYENIIQLIKEIRKDLEELNKKIGG
jgi:hypothetical protein